MCKLSTYMHTICKYMHTICTKYAEICKKYAEICRNMQKYASICGAVSAAEICKNLQIICNEYAKTCKICNHDLHVQNMQKYAPPTLLINLWVISQHCLPWFWLIKLFLSQPLKKIKTVKKISLNLRWSHHANLHVVVPEAKKPAIGSCIYKFNQWINLI